MSEGKGKGSGRCVGTKKAKCTKYMQEKRREKNKLRRIVKASGNAEALRYAEHCGLTAYVQRYLKPEKKDA